MAAPKPAPVTVEQNRFQQSLNRDLDILFMVDDSLSMKPLQTKMAARLGDFIDVLNMLPGGQPNLHIAIVSSSFGAGKFGNVSTCLPGHPGDDGGSFQQGDTSVGAPSCFSTGAQGLHSGEQFISSVSDGNGGYTTNFDGSLATTFSCMALLGDGGCGFESQFESVHYALGRATIVDDPNYGFLRDNAYLAVIMLTNEDDCSVDADSGLLDPSQFQLSDPLGGLQSYRCNEFGHLCDGQPPPHTVNGNVMLDGTKCVSADDMGPKANLGHLTKLGAFVDFLNMVKSPDKLLVAALAGPVTPYGIEQHEQALPNGQTETQPQITHSCMQSGGEYADPAVRIQQWVKAFGPNGVFEPICADDFKPAMVAIAQAIGKKLGTQCVTGMVQNNADGTPNCIVAQRTFSSTGAPVDKGVPFCNGNHNTTPCWEFQNDGMCTGGGQHLVVCQESTCSASSRPTQDTNALVSCAIAP